CWFVVWINGCWITGGTDNDLGFRIIGRVNADIGCWIS
ncbi:unnamed protein product, partial [Rotaria sp. Silwood1]